MIKIFRVALSACSVVLLLLGYVASQVTAMQGSYATYAEKMDSPPIRMLALLVFLAAIAFCFLPDKGESS